MTENCQHCNEVVTAAFCGSCGQKKYKRIDKRYIVDELQYTVLHMNKGFLYSVKSILKNPGKAAKAFIDGNRVSHYKPMLLTFVLSGIATFLSYKVLGLSEVMSAYYKSNRVDSEFTADFLTAMSSYNSIFMILLIPFFAMATKIAFRKWGHNYFEHIVMNSFILSYYTLFSIIFVYPLMFISKNSSPNAFMTITMISTLLVPVILTWFFKGFYPDRSLKQIILRVLVIMGLTFLGFMLLMVLFGVGFAVYAMITGPEALQYVKPK